MLPWISSFRRPFLALTRFTLQRFSSKVSYIAEERKEERRTGLIHPTALVHPNAVIGLGVSIGPYCTVGSSAKIGNGCQLYPASHMFGDTELGDSCVLMTGAVVGDDLPGRTVIGCNNIIGHHSVVGVKCQDLKYKLGDECFLEIGDNNEIREHASIHRSSKSSDRTVIGDNNLIMGSCHIAHDCKVGNSNIFANNTLLAGHVVVEDYTHTAGAIVVHQFCHIGSFSFIGGGSVVSQDIPKCMMVAGERAELRGLNLEGLRRHGFTDTEVCIVRNEKSDDSTMSLYQKFMKRFQSSFVTTGSIDTLYNSIIVTMNRLRTAYRMIFMPVDRNSRGFEERLIEVEQSEEFACVPAVCAMLQSIRESFAENRRGICKFRQWSGS